jgi:hypothetical protein
VNHREPCPRCGAPIATDQRYCIECGERFAPALSLPYSTATSGASRFALPAPLRAVSTLAAAALGFGVVVGTAMSPALSGPDAEPAPPVAQLPPSQAPTPQPPATAPPAAPAAPAPPATPPSSPGSPYAPGLSTGGEVTEKTVKPKPQIISGTVVQVNRMAGSYAVAPGEGPLVAIHAKKLPTAGMQVQTPVRNLLNGTYAEDGKRKTKGRRDKATFSGTVTFRDDEQGKDFYTVSSPGSSVLVRISPDAAGAATPPGFGTAVTVNVRLDPFTPPSMTTGTTTSPAPAPVASECDGDGEAVPATPAIEPETILSQLDVTVDQQSATAADVEGIVQAVCPGTGQLVLSADGARESGRDILVQAQQGIDLRKVHVGRSVVGGVELKPPDSLSLSGVASNQGIKGAESQKQIQGSP